MAMGDQVVADNDLDLGNDDDVSNLLVFTLQLRPIVHSVINFV